MMKKATKISAIVVWVLSLTVLNIPHTHAAAGLDEEKKSPLSQDEGAAGKGKSALLAMVNVDYFWQSVKKQFGKKTYSLPNLEDKEIVLLLGTTGVGKSTFINRMLGHEFDWEYEKIEETTEEDSDSSDDTDDEDTQGEKKLVMTKKASNAPIAGIGNDFEACTTVPQAYILQPENLVLVDCPGFDDTRGDAQEILNLSMIRLFVHKAKKVQAIIGMIAYSTFTDGGKGANFLALVKQLNSLVMVEKCLPNIFWGITRYSDEAKRQNVIDRITAIAKAKNDMLIEKGAMDNKNQPLPSEYQKMKEDKILLENLLENKDNILLLSPFWEPDKIIELKSTFTKIETSIEKAHFGFRHPRLDVKGIIHAIFSEPAKIDLVNAYKLHQEIVRIKAQKMQKIANNEAIINDEHQLGYYLKDKKVQLAQAEQAWEDAISETQALDKDIDRLTCYRTEHISLDALFPDESKTITYHDFPFDADALEEIYEKSKVKKCMKDLKPDNGVYRAKFRLSSNLETWLDDRTNSAHITVRFWVKNKYVQKELRVQKHQQATQKGRLVIEKKKELALAKEDARKQLKAETEEILPRQVQKLEEKKKQLEAKLEGEWNCIYLIGEVYPCLYPDVDDYLNQFAKGYKQTFKLFCKGDSGDDQKEMQKAPQKNPLPSGQLLIPANGHCLYTTVIMGYLLPVRQQVDEASTRIDQLFGLQPAGYLNRLYQTLKNPTHYLNYLHSDNFDGLSTAFMARMEIKKGTWGGPQEIQTIATKLKVNIQAHYPDPSNRASLVRSDLTKPTGGVSDITLHIVRDKVHPAEVLTQAEKASAKDNLHYQHYRLKYTLPSPLSASMVASQQPSIPHREASPPKSVMPPYLVKWFEAAESGEYELLVRLHELLASLYEYNKLLQRELHQDLGDVASPVTQSADVNSRNTKGNTALLLSAKGGHLKCIKFLIEQGADINARNTKGDTALLLSAQRGDVDSVKYLVEQGADINVRSTQDDTALLLSAQGGYLACIKYLVEQGADINVRNTQDDTALLLSAQKGHLDCLKYLVKKGAELEAKTKNGNTSLILSARSGHLESVKYLVSVKANIAFQGEDNKTALEWAKDKEENEVVDYLSTFVEEEKLDKNISVKGKVSVSETGLDIMKRIMEKFSDKYSIDLNMKDERGVTLLIINAVLGKLDTVKYLVKQGAEIDLKDDIGGSTALLWSSRVGQLEIIKYLVEQGANINAKNSDGATPLLASANRCHIECVKYLVEQGADVNISAKDGETALQVSASKGDSGCVKCLLEAGANANAKTRCGNTALLLSAHLGYLKCVEYLLERGAEIEASNEDGTTALIWSASKGSIESVKYLVQKGAKIEAKNNIGNTPLMLSAYSGHLDCVKFLLQQGANIEAKNKHGNTALMLSTWEGYLEILKYLISKGANIDTKNQEGNTALIVSAHRSHIECVKYLVEKGADLLIKNNEGKIALFIAQENNSRE